MATVENIIEKTAQEMYDRTIQIIEEKTGVSMKRLCELAAGDANGEIAPVVHAKWENNKDEYPECTNCGYMPMFDPSIDDIYYSPYCPNCGAKMDLTGADA